MTDDRYLHVVVLDLIAAGDCLCRLDEGDFYQPPDLDVNPYCPIHGDEES